jgi:hypothetical protein
MNARAEFQAGVDAGMAARDWIRWDRKFHMGNGIPRSEPDWPFARDGESFPCSHFFITEAN